MTFFTFKIVYMKIRILILVLSLIIFSKIQSQDIKSLYQQDADRYYQYLDKSQIPTGILYDRVARLQN